MRSPETAMGMAGGQPTVGRPQTRPREWAASTVSRGGKGRLADGAGALPPGQGQLGGIRFPRALPQGRGRLGQFLRGVLRGGHQHQEVPVGVLALHALAPQLPGQLLACHLVGRGHCHPQRVAGLHPPACGGEPSPKLRQAFDGLRQALGIALRQVAVAQIQRGQRQIRRAGGAKQPQGGLGQRRQLCRGGGGEVQIGPAGEHRQGLVGGIAAQIGAQIQGVERGLQKPQIGPVGVVHQQQGAVLVAYLGQSGDFRHAAQIVRAGEVYRRRRLRQAV